MPIENLDLSELTRRIGAAELTCRVREVPADEAHGLGHEPASADQIAAATELGTSLLTQLRAERVGVVLSRKIDWNDIITHLRLRPKDFDWRDHGAIGPVQNQGWCGSCVSFATTGLVGAQAEIELGIANLHLSEADQHFCSSHGANCGGWNNHDALDQIRTRGVVTDSAFPYMTAFDSPPQVTDPSDPNSLWRAYCRPELLRWLHEYKITNFTAHSGDDRKTYLSTVGPMVCGFTVYQDFDHYAGGVYKHVWGDVRGGHAVLVVGYSDTDGAWICRNSWGTGFGGAAQADGTGGGFFKLAYGDSNIDNEPFYGCRGVIAPHLVDLRLQDIDRLRIEHVIH